MALDVADADAELIHLILHIVGERLDMSRGVTGRNDHVVGEDGDVADLDDLDVQTLAGVENLCDFFGFL